MKLLLRRLVTVQEDERRRIARDLHDHLGQQLTALRLSLGMLRAAGGAPQFDSRLTSVERIVDQLDRDVDFLAWELRPAALDDVGLVGTLSAFVQQWSAQHGITAEVHSSRLEGVALGSDIQTNLYRIAQEALNNVAKHANATCVSLLLERRDGDVILIVEDDGRGFDVEHAARNSAEHRGMGLIGLRERAALLGGTVQIESRRKGKRPGTTVIVRVPRDAAAPAS